MNLRNKSARPGTTRRPKPAAGADSGLDGAGERHLGAGATLTIRAMPDIRSARNGTGLARAPARCAAIAQVVEHVIRNERVGGSNPSCGTRGRASGPNILVT